ncbi:MAG: hypothetical protein C0478_18255 [Planctomyces sp.]|nr:hypothetical protein [Planctomyces sp.]
MHQFKLHPGHQTEDSEMPARKLTDREIQFIATLLENVFLVCGMLLIMAYINEEHLPLVSPLFRNGFLFLLLMAIFLGSYFVRKRIVSNIIWKRNGKQQVGQSPSKE